MTDPLRDPRFPNRPSSPDFWRMVEVVNQLDGQATEGGRSTPEIAEGLVDIEALSYMAQMRALKARQLLGLPASAEMALAATFLNAFLAGIRFEQEGGHRE